jgi:spermidine/putrescine transport system permease protein
MKQWQSYKKISQLRSFFWAVPAVVWQIVLLYIPLIFVLMRSFVHKGGAHLFDQFSFRYYMELLDATHAIILFRSFMLAAVTASVCLLIAYPIAYFLSFYVSRFKNILLFFLIIPFWTSLLVQLYAWFFILDKHGVLNVVLQKLGILSEPYHLLNTPFAVYLVSIYCYIPFMIMPIYSILEKFDIRLREASLDLGATRWETFMRVTVPLSLPGIKTGFYLVFIPAFGEFVIPMLLGGGKQLYVGSLITHYFLVSRSPELGAAFTWLSSIVLIISTIVMQWLFVRAITPRKIRHNL